MFACLLFLVFAESSSQLRGAELGVAVNRLDEGEDEEEGEEEEEDDDDDNQKRGRVHHDHHHHDEEDEEDDAHLLDDLCIDI